MGTISNTIAHGITLATSGTYASPLTIAATGYIDNTGTGDAVYGDATQPWTLSNYGRIASLGIASRYGVNLRAGGSILNDGTITASGDGIDISGATGSVTNAGYIKGRIFGSTSGIKLQAGGTVTNQSGGTIVAGQYGVSIFADGGLANAGYIGSGSFGVFLNSSGAVTNQVGGTIAGLIPIDFSNVAATLINNGLISGKSIAVFTDGGVVFNQKNGTIKGPAGSNTAILAHSGVGYVNNAGYIVGSDAIDFFFGGTVINQIGGTIAGTAIGFSSFQFGFGTVSGPGTLTNAGTVSGGYGVYLTAGGTITNQSGGSIFGTGTAGVGVAVAGSAGTLANAGLVSGTRSGVLLKAGGSLLNSGTIVGSSGTAVSFSGTSSALVTLEPGAVFVGSVVGGSGNNTLELGSAGSTGTVAGLGTSFKNFGTIVVDAGAQWVLSGSNTINNGATLTNAGTLNIAGILIVDPATMVNSGYVAGTVTLAGGGYLDNIATGTIKAAGTAVLGITSANTVVNAGSIVATGAQGVGIRLASGGSINNGGRINASQSGIELVAGGTAINQSGGTIGASVPGLGNGILLDNGGSVVNQTGGTITADFNGVYAKGAATVTNAGSIGGYGGNTGVRFLAGGTLSNLAGGTIRGIEAAAYFKYAPGTVINAGLLKSRYTGTGVQMFDGGVVFNQQSGTIGVTVNSAIQIRGAPGYVNNAGLLDGGTQGGGIHLYFGGTVVNQLGGKITGVVGIDALPAGSVPFGGTLTLNNSGAIAGSFAAVYLSAGATVTNSGVISGGTTGIDLLAGGTVIDSGAIAGGGTAILFGGSATNLVVLEPSFQLAGKVIGSTAAGATDTLELDGHSGNPLTANYNSLNLINFETVAFGDGGYSTLSITNTTGMPSVVFSGFTLTSETINLTAIGTDGTISNTDTINHRVTITGSLGTATLQLDATDSVSLATSSDGVTGTNVSPVCFCRGTLILTERGDVAVEELAVGERVRTLSGALKPITWIGMGRDLVTRANKLARPVIVRQGALADGVPARDLYLTHGHGLYIDGVLIPVENLINHRSILWDEAARIVEYYHIELEDHDLVLANGAPAESYYDASNRAQFHNTRPGSIAGGEKAPFAPVLSGGEIVERLWRELFAWAGGRIDSDTSGDPDLHLVVDGRRLDASHIEGCGYIFAFDTAPDSGLRLCSRSAVPSLLGISTHDHRRLGVALACIELHQLGVATILEHDTPLLTECGCHPPENGYAWTDGELALPRHLFVHLEGAFTLTVRIERPGMRYPVSPGLAAAA